MRRPEGPLGWLAVVVAVAIGVVALWEAVTWWRARDLWRGISDPTADLAMLADRVATLEESSLLGLGTRGLGAAMGQRLLAEADQRFEQLQAAIDQNESPDPVSDQERWRVLDELYRRAQQFGGPRERIELRRHVVTGEIERLEAQRLYRLDRPDEADEALRRSEEALRRAGQIEPTAEELLLAQARLYYMGEDGGRRIFLDGTLDDVIDQLQDQVTAPERLGRTWRASRHLARGEELRQQALLVRGTAAECPLLREAAGELKTASNAFLELMTAGEPKAEQGYRDAERELGVLLNRVANIGPEMCGGGGGEEY